MSTIATRQIGDHTKILLGDSSGVIRTLDYNTAVSDDGSGDDAHGTGHASAIAAIAVSPKTNCAITAASCELFCWDLA